MNERKVAYNRETKTAMVLEPNSPPSDGVEVVGSLPADLVSPGSSHQHILNLLQRSGISDAQSEITIVNGPAKDRRSDENQADEAIEPKTAELAIGETIDLVDGTTKGMTFEVSDDKIVKIDRRSAKVTALAVGTATITVADKGGSANQVVITVREPVAPADNAGNGNASPSEGAESDAKEAADA